MIILNQALVFDQIKQSIIETYYDTLTLETAFYYFWLGFVIENLGESSKYSEIQILLHI